MSTYLFINIMIIIFPLILTFIMPVKYYKSYTRLFGAIAVTSVIFILWDILAVKRGDWSFNPAHVGTFRFCGLPLEEILFFITVPYSCLFIYENLKWFLKTKPLKKINPVLYLLPAALFFCAAYVFRNQYYTLTVSLFCAVLLVLTCLFAPRMMSSGIFWLTIGISYVMFILFNYFLTSLPIVLYNPAAFSGIRIFTIPLEDFFYNFALLSFYLFFYDKMKREPIQDNHKP